MIDKTEAQHEALRLAALLDINHHEPHVEQAAAAELRRQHAEIEQLRSQFEPTIEDNSQNWAQCDPAVAFHLIDRHSDNWADAGKMMTEFAEAKAEIKLKALHDELTTQANRAAAAEQQVTALTQRLDTANALNTEARNELAQLQLSARQAVPNPWQQAIDHELVCLHLGVAGETTKESALKALRELIQCHVEIAINPQTNGGLSLQPHTEAQAAPDGLHQAAQAVIDRWDSPLWRQEVGTNVLINDLRAALSAAPSPPEREPLQMIECKCGDAFEFDSYNAGFTDAAGKCPNCSAADEATH